jgi:YVTN family beta-propeller protein
VYCGIDPLGDDSLAVIDCATNSVITVMHTGTNLTALCYNPTANKLYCADSSLVLVLDGVTDSVVAVVDLGDIFFGVTSMCYDSVRNKLYCAVMPCSVIVIDGVGDSIITSVTLDAIPNDLCFNPVAGKVYCAETDEGHAVAVIDCVTDSLVVTIPVQHFPAELTCNPISNKVYGVTYDGATVFIIDCAGDSLLGQLPAGYSPKATCFNSADNRVYCTSFKNDFVTVVDGTADSVLTRVIVGCRARMMYYDSLAAELYCLCATSSVLMVVDGHTDRVVKACRTGLIPVASCHVPSARRLYLGSPLNRVVVFDLNSDSIVRTLNVQTSPQAMCWNWVDNTVYCTNGDARSVSVIDVAADSVVATVPVSVRPAPVCYNSVGNEVYCGNGSDTLVSVIDCATKREVARIRAGRPSTLGYNPQNNKVYATGDSIYIIEGFTKSVRAVAGFHGCVGPIRYSARHNKVYCGDVYRDWVVVIDGATDSVLAVVVYGPGGDLFGGLHMYYDETTDRLYCSDYSHGRVHVIEGATDSIVAAAEVPGEPAAQAWNADRRVLYVSEMVLSSVSVISDTLGSAVGSSSMSTGPRWQMPTILRKSQPLYMPAPGTIMDVVGRQATRLLPGPNDVRTLAPGVYFILTRSNHHPRKVVVPK